MRKKYSSCEAKKKEETIKNTAPTIIMPAQERRLWGI
jgi:hypothetical protein